MNSFQCLGKVMEAEFIEHVEMVADRPIDHNYHKIKVSCPHNFTSYNNDYGKIVLTIYLWEGAGGYIGRAQRKDLPVVIKGRFDHGENGPILFGEHIRVVEV